jgi:8-oxo-dGTP diphosphatase
MDVKPMVRVLAAVIEREGRYLVCLRPPHKRHGGLWEFPGGKLEAGESLAEAARRELWEELGIGTTSVGTTLFVHRETGSPFQIEFVEVTASGTPQALEHEAIRWARIEELKGLPLAPSDRAFLEWLQS